MNIPEHPASHKWFHLPDGAGKQLISHAIRKIPNYGDLLPLMFNKSYKLGQELPKHAYKNGGKLEWAYLNT